LRTDHFDMTGKVALVTGGSRGLGCEMVRAFAAYGADVIIASRNIGSCKAIAQEVEAMGRRTLPYACHVGRWSDLEGLVDAAYDKFARIDVLVNNAGMSPLAPSSLETSEELFDKIMAVNFKGPFRLTALVGSRMVAAGGGAIINISSSGSFKPHPRFGPYAGAKAALNTITMAFALEYAPTVRVNAIAAGAFLTDVSKQWTDEQRTRRPTAIGHPAQPHEIVTSALYLASDASSFTTGAVLRVDGGLI
jgi:NAD(P)-dependent dehydrogenase (short-subunit alcohol dehydrogenase family)